MPYSYRIENAQNAPTFSLGDSFTITITNDEDGSVATFRRIVSKVGKQVSFKNELGEFIRSRKPKRILGNIEGIQLPFHLPLGITFSLWVYSGPQQAEVAVPPPETSGDSAFARRLAVEELRARQWAT